MIFLQMHFIFPLKIINPADIDLDLPYNQVNNLGDKISPKMQYQGSTSFPLTGA